MFCHLSHLPLVPATTPLLEYLVGARGDLLIPVCLFKEDCVLWKLSFILTQPYHWVLLVLTSVCLTWQRSPVSCALGLHDSLPQNVTLTVTFICVKQPSCPEMTCGTYPWPHAPPGWGSHVGGRISGHTHNAFQSKESSWLKELQMMPLSCVWMEPRSAHSCLSRFLCGLKQWAKLFHFSLRSS